MKQQFFPQRLFMDMKRLIINRLVGLGLLVVGALHDTNAMHLRLSCLFLHRILGWMIIPPFRLWKIISSGERIMYTIRLVKK